MLFRSVTTAQEMAELVDGSGPNVPSGVERSASATRVLDALSSRTARGIDDLAARSGLSLGDVQAVLGELDLDGAAEERTGGWVSRNR